MSHRTTLAALSLLVAAALLSGCGGFEDGAPVGTGITTRVVGNVVDTTAPVEVSLDEYAAIATRSDADGYFELAGDFSGDVSLRFTTADYAVVERLAVPLDSALALSDVELSQDGVDVQSTLQLDFAGRVQRADCASGFLTVIDPTTSTTSYRVEIDSDTTITRSSDGTVAACSDITTGTGVIVDGFAEEGATRRLIALRIIVGSDTPGPVAPTYTLPLSGNVVAIDCERRAVHIANELSRTRLRLDRQTTIADAGGAALACETIQIGDRITGSGVFELQRPASIRATALVVAPETRSNVRLRFVGNLTVIDCASGALQLDYQRALTLVRLTENTVFEADVSCAVLQLGDRVSGAGRVRPAHPGEIEASRLLLRKRAR